MCAGIERSVRGGVVSHILFGLVLAFGGVASLATAQTPSDFQGLAATVHPGERVIITETGGRTYTADVIETSPSTLTVRGRRQRAARVLTPADIAKVHRPDSVMNGVLMGMAGGVLVAAVSCSGAGGEWGEACLPVTSLALLPLGGLFGALVDASMHRRLYVAPLPPGTIRLGLRPRRGGMMASASITW